MDNKAALKSIVKGLVSLDLRNTFDQKAALPLLVEAFEKEHESLFAEVLGEIEAEKRKAAERAEILKQEMEAKSKANWDEFAKSFRVNGRKMNEAMEYKTKKYTPVSILRPLMLEDMKNLPDARTSPVEFQRMIFSEWNQKVVTAMVHGAMLDFTFSYVPR